MSGIAGLGGSVPDDSESTDGDDEATAVEELTALLESNSLSVGALYRFLPTEVRDEVGSAVNELLHTLDRLPSDERADWMNAEAWQAEDDAREIRATLRTDSEGNEVEDRDG